MLFRSVAEAVDLMRKYDIEHIPIMKEEELAGSISESGLFQKIFTNPEMKTATIESVMESAYSIVSFDTPVERLGGMITKDNGAVLAKDDSGNMHIVTKYDIIQSLAK